ncbi:MAG: bifunctional hydroxymethylpyrimidine kinase/phosphomethylpyrimidine kinase [Oscillospiraceae bacterium]
MIYTGYLSSFAQIDLVSQLIDDFKRPETLVFVDPAMADNGRLYAGFDDAFPKKMASLCAKADLIVPNITEAALLTGTPYRPQQDSAYARSLLLRLADLGARVSVLTGVDLGDGKTGHRWATTGRRILFSIMPTRRWKLCSTAPGIFLPAPASAPWPGAWTGSRPCAWRRITPPMHPRDPGRPDPPLVRRRLRVGPAVPHRPPKKSATNLAPIAHCARPQNLTPQQKSPPPTPVRAILTAKNKKASKRLRRARRK